MGKIGKNTLNEGEYQISSYIRNQNIQIWALFIVPNNLDIYENFEIYANVHANYEVKKIITNNLEIYENLYIHILLY